MTNENRRGSSQGSGLSPFHNPCQAHSESKSAKIFQQKKLSSNEVKNHGRLSPAESGKRSGRVKKAHRGPFRTGRKKLKTWL